MSSRYFSTFELERFKTVVVAGYGSRNALISQLAREAYLAGRKPLLLADSKLEYPPEGQFQVGDEISLLFQKSTGSGITGPVYLAADVQDKYLLPFSGKQLLKIISGIPEQALILLRVEPDNKDLVASLRFDEEILFVCAIDFDPIKIDLMAARLSADEDQSEKEKQAAAFISKLLKELCSSENWHELEDHFVLFVNNVNDIFDENLFIPVGRNLKTKGVNRIYYGNLNHYQIKSI